jgi:hypothetical protein
VSAMAAWLDGWKDNWKVVVTVLQWAGCLGRCLAAALVGLRAVSWGLAMAACSAAKTVAD